MLLETIKGPRDVQRLSRDEAKALAGEIRTFLVSAVARTGGHLGPNLGVVELTIAIHRAFDSPHDTVVWDTGHQSYVHKLLTGRQDFSGLRSAGGLSGYPSRAESEHDVVENSHATTSLSWADGIAQAYRLRGEHDRHVVAVIGDGALTGGMAWEAINNIAADKTLPLTIIVNDNERSYAPTTGGLAQHLATLRTTRGYERFLAWGKQTLGRTPVVGSAMYDTLHGVKKGLKDIVAPQGMFEDLGLKYVGPVDGHDIEAVEKTLRQARTYGGPVLVHVLTQKGRGYAPALADEGDRFHAVGPIDPETGEAVASSGVPWTDVFEDELVRIARRRQDVVGITAAMCIPVGLAKFQAEFPQRVFDVGIAEQHAATSAAGMAFAGLHPVFAVYATFLNRAFDQLLMDIALHKAGVTFVLDRAGVTGPDGASHHGMWDLSLLQVVPGIHVAAPRDAARVREELREALDVADAPSVLRYSKGSVPAQDIPAVERVGGVDVLHRSASADVLVVTVGPMAGIGLDVAHRLTAHGMAATVVDPRWVLPVDPALVEMAGQVRLVVVIEDGSRVGGVGSRLAQEVTDAGLGTRVVALGIPPHFLDHGDRGAILASLGLTGQDVTRRVVEELARLEPAMDGTPVVEDSQ
ncbi:1-deoxy-D-xylulose-5-phosphate synthase [Angustibacter luteus]|uniref:1-deoxy-D-xylulose-5-phosphate synthase n=1 Tax=Angustibacter luteus TaxID=658456 RepID=A0ABW1JA82_9ACTN